MSVSITIDSGGQTSSAPQQDPLTAEAVANWKRDPALRAEFDDNFECYAAFERARAAGRIRVLGQRAGSR